MKLKFILIHSTGGDANECWYPWLRNELEILGHEVIAPNFPSPEGQSLTSWMKIFDSFWKEVDEKTIFIGRSIGPPFILRLLERLDKPVLASFLVAGFCSDLKLDEFRSYVDSFIEQPFDWDKIKSNCRKFFVYHGADDPIVKLSYGEELAGKLDVKLTVIEDGGHFNIGTNYGHRFQQILEDIKNEFNL